MEATFQRSIATNEPCLFRNQNMARTRSRALINLVVEPAPRFVAMIPILHAIPRPPPCA